MWVRMPSTPVSAASLPASTSVAQTVAPSRGEGAGGRRADPLPRRRDDADLTLKPHVPVSDIAPAVAELTGLLNLTGWPAGMRVIIRKERPHPGAQLTITDVNGHRITAFATNTRTGQLADLELRHRRRARCEDRIRLAKDTGLTNLPLHGFTQNQIWCAIVALAAELTAWMQLLALTDQPARRWEPKRLRYRLYTIPAAIARGGRQQRIRYAGHHPWVTLLIGALTALNILDST